MACSLPEPPLDYHLPFLVLISSQRPVGCWVIGEHLSLSNKGKVKTKHCKITRSRRSQKRKEKNSIVIFRLICFISPWLLSVSCSPDKAIKYWLGGASFCCRLEPIWERLLSALWKPWICDQSCEDEACLRSVIAVPRSARDCAEIKHVQLRTIIRLCRR